jgi:hypothetical protein
MLGLLLLSLLQIQGTDVPESFLTKEYKAYFGGCLRIEAKGSPDAGVPRLSAFTQLMSFCGEERARWADVLQGLIQARHPEWTKERVSEAVELVITGFELKVLTDQHGRIRGTVHDVPEAQF